MHLQPQRPTACALRSSKGSSNCVGWSSISLVTIATMSCDRCSSHSPASTNLLQSRQYLHTQGHRCACECTTAHNSNAATCNTCARTHTHVHAHTLNPVGLLVHLLLLLSFVFLACLSLLSRSVLSTFGWLSRYTSIHFVRFSSVISWSAQKKKGHCFLSRHAEQAKNLLGSFFSKKRSNSRVGPICTAYNTATHKT